MKQICFLIGFMGCGKTHWGLRLAQQTQTSFLDLDQWIESEKETTISSIFELHGERQFRILEREFLHRLPGFAPQVVATGGGTPCFFDNMRWMNAHGVTIYLRAPVSLLAARIRMDGAVRPLLRATREEALESAIARLLDLRRPYYEQAHVILDQQGNDPGFLQQLASALETAAQNPRNF